jgi:uncharacterized protein (DUF302 family)
MRRILAGLAFLAAVTSPSAFAVDGFIAERSPYSVADTMDRLSKIVMERGLTIFAKIDHAKGATTIGKSLRPTELIIFGNPQGGTPLMECAQTVGIDLPLKALVWEDAKGTVWVGYSDPLYIVKRHSVPQCAAAEKLREALSKIVGAAVAR